MWFDRAKTAGSREPSKRLPPIEVPGFSRQFFGEGFGSFCASFFQRGKVAIMSFRDSGFCS